MAEKSLNDKLTANGLNSYTTLGHQYEIDLGLTNEEFDNRAVVLAGEHLGDQSQEESEQQARPSNMVENVSIKRSAVAEMIEVRYISFPYHLHKYFSYFTFSVTLGFVEEV